MGYPTKIQLIQRKASRQWYVNFPAALKRIRQRSYLDLILTFLPDNNDTGKVRDKIFAYVDSRIKQSS